METIHTYYEPVHVKDFTVPSESNEVKNLHQLATAVIILHNNSSPRQSPVSGAEEMAQSLKSLLGKYKEQNLH